jgi:hypothetical protein
MKEVALFEQKSADSWGTLLKIFYRNLLIPYGLAGKRIVWHWYWICS